MSDIRPHTFAATGTKPAETKDMLYLTDPNINMTNARGDIGNGHSVGPSANGGARTQADAEAASPRNTAEVARTAAEVAQAIDGMNHAQDQDNLDQWRSWAMGIAGTT